MSDDGSQETQLRGKQLVFLGMSVTVVAVVIFLCGVMVGRGVPTARQASSPAIEADPATNEATADGGDAAESELIITPAPGGPTAPLEYPVIVSDQPGTDSLVKTAEAPRQPFTVETAAARPAPARPEPPKPTPTSPTPKASVPAPSTAAKAAPKTPAVATTSTVSTGSGTAEDRGAFLVQVAAYQREGDATKLGERLKRKGYPAFVTTATSAAGTWFRVRVGSFDTRADAQKMATRLKREEQLEPWVTR